MAWEELDLLQAIWTIPGERTKNSQEHTLDLSPQVLAILMDLPTERRGLVFTTTGTTPVSGFSKAKTKADSLMAGELNRDVPEGKHKTLKPWRVHDLRRTMATLMGEELDVNPGVIERVLNHISGSQGGLMGTYQLQKYPAKRKAAMIAWANWLDVLTSGEERGNVVALSDFRA